MKDLSKWITYAGVFVLPFLVLIVADSLFFPYITGKGFFFRIVVEIITAAWIVYALYESRVRPKVSYIAWGFIALVVIMFFADLFGQYAPKSFWSNFERMDGYVTLVHLFLYFVVVSSVLTTEKLWYRFLTISVGVASTLALYSFAQLSGEIEINQGGWRLDGTLGNAAYMAVYQLFHIAFALLLFFRTHTKWLRYLYGGLAVVFTFLLVQTATRGTILGLAGGILLAVLYALVREQKYRKVAGGILLGWVILVAGFIVFKDASVIQENQYLSRVANITLDEGSVRFALWDIALEGVKDRPLLGWGQENFNYVFNTYYTAEIYNAEQWYDRVHNIVFDWLIAGGILGALAYFSLLFFTLYYLFRQRDMFTLPEQSILFGLLGAYMFHNLFVFDNTVSYFLYISVIALVHSRVGKPVWQEISVSREVTGRVIAPALLIVTALVVYSVNVPPMKAGAALIDSFSASSSEKHRAIFTEALSYETFGNQEIREQMIQVFPSIYQSQSISAEEKRAFALFIDEEIKNQVMEKPSDARVHALAAPFYRITRVPDQALQHLAIAIELSPEKQQFYIDAGLAYLQKDNLAEALAVAKHAYELESKNKTARLYYGLMLILSGDREGYREISEGYEEVFDEHTFIKDALATQGW
ncbi:O-antigen ligase family protein [Candidatus Kaiserbacteria bacterium]|nr:O-antigen ligase family protein [Candidatus Kaiserbacteria bacterium]